MNEFLISAYAASDVGRRRQNNEDNYYIAHKKVDSALSTNARINDVAEVFIGSVCDGMGGEETGELASQFAVDTVEMFESCLVYKDCSDESINEVVSAANDKICNEIRKRRKRMGTTFTLIGITNGNVTVANIGDSRVYRYSDNFLEQISRDHTEAQTMVDAGIVTKEQSMKLKEKHRLTQHLGIFPEEMIIEPYIVRLPAEVNDRYLLCSDGLTDMLTESEIEKILSENLTLKATVDKLISSALEKGGKDNVTVLMCEINKNNNAFNENVKPVARKNKSVKSNQFNIWKLTSIILAAALIAMIVAFAVEHKNNSRNNNIVSVSDQSMDDITSDVASVSDQSVDDIPSDVTFVTNQSADNMIEEQLG